tara:strand:- start:533 stop:694 length:162 start_codon:yes stop_codon:yes gene_type:complete
MNLLYNQDLKWKCCKVDKNFDFPIDYYDAILDARKDGEVLSISTMKKILQIRV